jgi:hypothetical protein
MCAELIKNESYYLIYSALEKYDEAVENLLLCWSH